MIVITPIVLFTMSPRALMTKYGEVARVVDVWRFPLIVNETGLPGFALTVSLTLVAYAVLFTEYWSIGWRRFSLSQLRHRKFDYADSLTYGEFADADSSIHPVSHTRPFLCRLA